MPARTPEEVVKAFFEAFNSRKPVQMEGATSDVLRKQPDGRWLFVIDNPWGAAILG